MTNTLFLFSFSSNLCWIFCISDLNRLTAFAKAMILESVLLINCFCCCLITSSFALSLLRDRVLSLSRLALDILVFDYRQIARFSSLLMIDSDLRLILDPVWFWGTSHGLVPLLM
eukprot:797606_1